MYVALVRAATVAGCQRGIDDASLEAFTPEVLLRPLGRLVVKRVRFDLVGRSASDGAFGRCSARFVVVVVLGDDLLVLGGFTVVLRRMHCGPTNFRVYYCIEVLLCYGWIQW